MAFDADRARSIETTVRTAGALMVKVGIPDVTKLGDVKAHLKELLASVSKEHAPATTATPAMLKLMLERLVDERYPKNQFVAARLKVQLIAEGVGGCRLGEVVGGGEGHGLLAELG